MESIKTVEQNTWKDCQAQLLAELDVLCLKNNIRMWKYEEHSCKCAICVDANDAEKLIRVLEEKVSSSQNRAVESMLNNPKYPSFGLRYCDTSTTDFNIINYDKFENNCIHVEIRFIEHIASLGISFALSRAKFRKNKKHINNLKREDSVKLFGELLKIASNKSKNVWINGKQWKLDEIENREYLPWNEKEIYEYKESTVRFISCDLVWKDYKKAIANIDLGKCKKLRKEEKKWASMFVDEHSKIRASYDILERTFDRIYLFQKYEPRKQELLKMDAEGNKQAIREVLAEYIEFIDKHYQRNLGLCFDTDILEIALKIIKEDKGEKYAEKARILVPEEHLKPLRLKDYRGNYIK